MPKHRVFVVHLLLLYSKNVLTLFCVSLKFGLLVFRFILILRLPLSLSKSLGFYLVSFFSRLLRFNFINTLHSVAP